MIVNNSNRQHIIEKQNCWVKGVKIGRKCPIGTVSVCLKKNDVGKLILCYSDIENGEAKQFEGLFGYSYFCNVTLRVSPGQNPRSTLNNRNYILF